MKTFAMLAFFGVAAFAVAFAAPAAAQSSKDQLKKANEGAKARDHVFDGRRAPPPAVRAQPAQKPSMVGRPASEFRPQVKVKSSAAPPPPPRNLNPTGDRQVQRGIDNYRKPDPKKR